MTYLMYAIMAGFALLFAAGWVALICAVVFTTSGALVALPVTSATRLSEWVRRPFAEPVGQGVLCLEGLAGNDRLGRRVRTDIARVLAFASPETRPRACACVKNVDAGYVGVMRVFNTKGHYLLRVTGSTAAAVGERFVAELGAFRDTFPAAIGARRIRCVECDSSTCPLRLLKRQGAQPVAA
jgi:hypothetical protein